MTTVVVALDSTTDTAVFLERRIAAVKITVVDGMTASAVVMVTCRFCRVAMDTHVPV
jgi:hypothetical protein